MLEAAMSTSAHPYQQHEQDLTGSMELPARLRTPREIMKKRQEREARKLLEADRHVKIIESQDQQQQNATAVGASGRTEAAAPAPTTERRSRRRSDRPSRQSDSAGTTARQSNRHKSSVALVELPSASPEYSEDMPAASGQSVGHARGNESRLHRKVFASREAGPSETSPPATNVWRQRGSSSSDRWEQLSAHWEGLTSYWLRKLESNQDALNQAIPSAAAMSRQVTDLSAAGANLFHAVVELQRLRASSDRKFQRWFLDVKQEQEMAREARASLEKKLQYERSAHAKEQALLSRMEIERNLAEMRVSELTKELFINKEEARRAWEELGRREVEERDRVLSLREGMPTVVGGMQVVPMHSQGSDSRMPDTRDGPGYQTSSTDTDPFTESGRSGPTMPHDSHVDTHVPSTAGDGPSSTSIQTAIPLSAWQSSTRPVTRGNPVGDQSFALPVGHNSGDRFYQLPLTNLDLPGGKQQAGVNAPSPADQNPDGPLTNTHVPGKLLAGQHRARDDDYDEQADIENKRAQAGRYAVERSDRPEDEPGSDDDNNEWDDVQDARHHHPTRLSDVLEEDDDGRPRSKHSVRI